jgi:TPR repeat protein
MYADGHGVAKNEAPAVKLWPAAADQGDARAQCNLGVMYTGAASPRTRRSR